MHSHIEKAPQTIRREQEWEQTAKGCFASREPEMPTTMYNAIGETRHCSGASN